MLSLNTRCGIFTSRIGGTTGDSYCICKEAPWHVGWPNSLVVGSAGHIKKRRSRKRRNLTESIPWIGECTLDKEDNSGISLMLRIAAATVAN